MSHAPSLHSFFVDAISIFVVRILFDFFHGEGEIRVGEGFVLRVRINSFFIVVPLIEMSMIELVMQRYVFYKNDTNTLCFLTCQRSKKRL
jgi:hypothetical protein